MKSYNHLFEKLISDENILQAISNATLGKRNRQKWKELFLNKEDYVEYFRNEMAHFHNDIHTPKEIYDGITRKKRTIIVPTMREQVLHHMIVQVLKPIVMHGLYEHAYGSLPGRGVHSAKVSMAKWIHRDQNVNYVVKADITRYFYSINRDFLKSKLERVIRDKKFLEILSTLISVDNSNYGLPLGFYTSQWLSMFYLKDFDHYVKSIRVVKHYMRYVDDIVILCYTKDDAKNALSSITSFINIEGLGINRKTQIYKFDNRDIDFMGFRFFKQKTILRKTILFKLLRKARKLKKKKYITIYDIRQMMSYIGWYKWCMIHDVWQKYVTPNFSIKNAKIRISKFDKRRSLSA